MTIEQKLAYLKKALEMGADVDVYFHNFKTKEEAAEVVAELNGMVGEFEELAGEKARWFKNRGEDLSTCVFFDNKYMIEDIFAEEDEEIA